MSTAREAIESALGRLILDGVSLLALERWNEYKLTVHPDAVRALFAAHDAEVAALRARIAELDKGDKFFSAEPLKPRVFKYGDKWCAVWPDFIDLQMSDAGFGDTPELAATELQGAKHVG